MYKVTNLIHNPEGDVILLITKGDYEDTAIIPKKDFTLLLGALLPSEGLSLTPRTGCGPTGWKPEKPPEE